MESTYLMQPGWFYKWDKETEERHVTRPFYKCKNIKTLQECVKDDKIRGVILEMTDRIVEKFSPSKIILFGSHARNDANSHSDIDLLVIFKNEIKELKTMDEMHLLLINSPYPKDILACSVKSADQYKDISGYTVYYALKEGVVLYE